MGVNLATCPVCRCVVDDAQAHAKTWHEPIARVLEFTSLSSGVVSRSDGPRWGGPPVPAPPDPPTEAEKARAATLRARASAAYQETQTLTEQLEAYLTATSGTQPPTLLEVNEQVRLLTVATRDLLAAARDLIRLSTRALQEP